MMIPKRLSVKFFISNPEAANLPSIVPVFQRWIQQNTVEGLLIDVADYKHVPDGPGVLLIAHEGDYALNMSEGKPGIQYTYKQIVEDSLVNALIVAIERASRAAQTLETEDGLNLKVDYQQIQITLLDRLNFPNTLETFDRVRDAFQSAMDTWSGEGELTFLAQNVRQPFSVQINVPENEIRVL